MTRLLRILLILLGITLLGYFGLQFFLKKKIEKELSQHLPASWNMDYQDLELHLASGSISLKNIALQMRDTASPIPYADIEAEVLGIHQISYLDLLKGDGLSLGDCKILQPSIIYRPYAHSKDSIPKPANPSKKNLFLQNLVVEQGRFQLYTSEEDSLGIRIANFNLILQGLKTKEKNNSDLLPIDWKSISMDMDSLSMPLGPYEELKVSHGSFSQDSLQLTSFQIATLLDREAFTKQLKKEQDHYRLDIPDIKLYLPQLGKAKESLSVGFAFAQVDSPKFEVYRDKLLPDDFSTKSLFNEKFRELPFQLRLDSLQIREALIHYIERDQYYNEGGELRFQKLNISGKNIGNAYPDETPIEIEGEGYFMDEAPLRFEWEFDPKSLTDDFHFAAEVDAMPASDINPLTGNNLNVFFDGRIDYCHFSIYGNNYHSRYHFKIRYQDLEVEILNRKKGKTNWLGTKIANLLLKNNSKNKNSNHRQHQGEVSRIPTKSFFNYLWLNVADGLVHTVL